MKNLHDVIWHHMVTLAGTRARSCPASVATDAGRYTLRAEGTYRTRGDWAMSDFAEEIRRRVAAARDAADEQKQAGRRQAQSQVDQLARRKQRASELGAEIEQRFKEAAEGSSGAMVYSRQADHYGRVTATLAWREPGPPRELRIYVNPSEGLMDWSWVVNRVVKKAQRADPLTFDSARLHELIYVLSDQEAWSKGPPPV
jgi:hypothetical protein